MIICDCCGAEIELVNDFYIGETEKDIHFCDYCGPEIISAKLQIVDTVQKKYKKIADKEAADDLKSFIAGIQKIKKSEKNNNP